MSQSSRYYCNRCGQSIYHAHVNGERVPLALYLVVGQPEDTGPPVDVGAVAVPQFVRELLAQPEPRLTLCVACVAIVFRVPVVPPLDVADPRQVGVNAEGAVLALPATADKAMRTAARHARAIAALELPAEASGEASAVMSATVGVAVPMADRAWAGAKASAPAGGGKRRRGTATKPVVRHAVTPWMAALLQAAPLEPVPASPDDAPQLATPPAVPASAPAVVP